LAHDATDNLLFVSDMVNNRVLAYDMSNPATGMNASYVLGSTSYTGISGVSAQAEMVSPQGLAYDSADHLLYVASDGENAVVAFSTSSLTNGENASYILGASSYPGGGTNDTQAGLSSPHGVAYDAGDHLLFVGDGGNNRVVAYSTSSLTNGENASYVLGQSSYTTAATGLTQDSLNLPEGLAFDPVNKILYVADYHNIRILGFPVSSLSNDENASTVLGQSDFVSNNSTASTTGLIGPWGMAYDASNNRLWVADDEGSRLVAYNFVDLTNTPGALPAATTDSAYSATLGVSNSQGTVTYAVTAGNLPAGITLNSSTGKISGTPTTAGTYNFEITATDDTGTIGSFIDDPAFSITVSSPSVASSSVGAPNTGFGVFTANPLRTLTEFGIAAIGLFGIALTIRKFAKR
jgi:sugar lactone lactonase YvrE